MCISYGPFKLHGDIYITVQITEYFYNDGNVHLDNHWTFSRIQVILISNASQDLSLWEALGAVMIVYWYIL